MRKLFGTDGIRGVANQYPMTAEMAMQVGSAIATIVKKQPNRHRIVIGTDTRQSCYMLENALAAGITSIGVDVLRIGAIPTPGIAFITTSMRAGAGVVISASHNPFIDNGIKIFSGDGFKLPDDVEAEIEQRIFSRDDTMRADANNIGKARRIDDARGRYIVFLKNTFPKELTLDGVHIVLDCAHGAGYGVAPYVFEELGAKVTALGVAPNGRNINAECGALYPEKTAAEVRKNGADIGLALDGDADRLIVCDEHGDIVDGDQIMAICAHEMIAQKRLNKQTLVATVMSNLGLEVAMKKMGGTLLRTAVGDRYVVEAMRKGDYSLGGEQSGHLVFFDHNTTGDGTLAALQLLAVMGKREKPISELARVMERFPQTLQNVPTVAKVAPDAIDGLADAVAHFEHQLGESGRILVRTSGTESVIRVMVEAESEREALSVTEALCDIIRTQTGS